VRARAATRPPLPEWVLLANTREELVAAVAWASEYGYTKLEMLAAMRERERGRWGLDAGA
jgi:hypothetical protein